MTTATVELTRRPAATATPLRAERIPALDGLRGIAVLAVMIHHFVSASTIYRSPVWRFGDSMWWGVDLFFVLSGFLITGILWDAKERPHYFRNFYARRTLRIFPLYYGVLAVALLTGLSAPHQSWLWLYGTNLRISIGGWVFNNHRVGFDHFWSLAVEEHFYLVWPLLILLINRRSAMAACGMIVVGALACRCYLVWRGHLIAAYVLTPCRADALAIGAWIALAARAEQGLEGLRRLATRAALISAIVIIALAARHLLFSALDPWVATIGYSALAVLGGGILIASVRALPGKPLYRLFTSRSLTNLGKYSYGLYVFHFLLAQLLPFDVLASKLGNGLMAAVVCCAAGIAISYAVAWVSWNYYEVRFIHLKRFFDSRRSAPLAPSLAADELLVAVPQLQQGGLT